MMMVLMMMILREWKAVKFRRHRTGAEETRIFIHTYT